jgi:hypothetical protein
MTVELNKQEVSNIILSCETLMEQLSDDYKSDNKDKWYALANIVLKLKTTHD